MQEEFTPLYAGQVGIALQNARGVAGIERSEFFVPPTGASLCSVVS